MSVVFMFVLRGSVSARTGLCDGILILLARRRRYATIVTRQSLSVAYGEVYASGLLEGCMGLLGTFWHRACACFAKRMTTGRAVRASDWDGCLTNMTSPHVCRVRTVRSVQLSQRLGHLFVRDCEFALADGAGVLRELPRRTINPILLKQLSSLRHHFCKSFRRRWNGAVLRPAAHTI